MGIVETWRRLVRSGAVPSEAHLDALPGDAPIDRFEQDRLSRAPMAGRIAQILAAGGGSDGRVFAIRGAWGHGKSSLKNLVIEVLAQRFPNIPVLDFNPWQWGDSDAIARALFIQMAGKLGGAHGPAAAKRARALRTYGGLLTGGSAHLKTAAQSGPGIAWLLTGAAALSALLGIAWPGIDAKTLGVSIIVLASAAWGLGYFLNWLGKDRSADSLEDIRAELVRRLSSLAQPLVVFVDDIDRLEPEQIRLIIRQIKANASLPNITFVLLYQPSIVEDALKPVSAGEGRDYLEKIVQASFDLPPVTGHRRTTIFLGQLDALIAPLATPDNGFNQTRWGNILRGGIEPIIRNLRDSRRLLTSIAIHVEMHKGEHAFEANIIDFVGLEAMRVFEPDFHRALGLSKSLLTQSRRFSGDGRQDVDKADVAALLAIVSAERAAACRRLLIELFPPIEWALGGTYYADGFGRTWQREKRVCTQRNFDRYFALQLGEDVLSESDFALFVGAAGDPAALTTVVEDLKSRGLQSALADRIQQSVDDIPIERPELILAVIMANGEALNRGGPSSQNEGYLNSWVAAHWYLKRLPDSGARRQALDLALEASGGMTVLATLLGLERETYAKPDRDDPPLLTQEDLSALERLWTAQMEQDARDVAHQLAKPSLIGRLFSWQLLGGADAPRAWATEIGRSPELLPALLRGFINRGTMQSMNDLVATETKSFHREHFEAFLPVETVRETLHLVDRGTLTDEDRQAVHLFERYAASWDAGRAEPGRDSESLPGNSQGSAAEPKHTASGED